MASSRPQSAAGDPLPAKPASTTKYTEQDTQTPPDQSEDVAVESDTSSTSPPPTSGNISTVTGDDVLETSTASSMSSRHVAEDTEESHARTEATSEIKRPVTPIRENPMVQFQARTTRVPASRIASARKSLPQDMEPDPQANGYRHVTFQSQDYNERPSRISIWMQQEIDNPQYHLPIVSKLATHEYVLRFFAMLATWYQPLEDFMHTYRLLAAFAIGLLIFISNSYTLFHYGIMAHMGNAEAFIQWLYNFIPDGHFQNGMLAVQLVAIGLAWFAFLMAKIMPASRSQQLEYFCFEGYFMYFFFLLHWLVHGIATFMSRSYATMGVAWRFCGVRTLWHCTSHHTTLKLSFVPAAIVVLFGLASFWLDRPLIMRAKWHFKCVKVIQMLLIIFSMSSVIVPAGNLDSAFLAKLHKGPAYGYDVASPTRAVPMPVTMTVVEVIRTVTVTSELVANWPTVVPTTTIKAVEATKVGLTISTPSITPKPSRPNVLLPEYVREVLKQTCERSYEFVTRGRSLRAAPRALHEALVDIVMYYKKVDYLDLDLDEKAELYSWVKLMHYHDVGSYKHIEAFKNSMLGFPDLLARESTRVLDRIRRIEAKGADQTSGRGFRRGLCRLSISFCDDPVEVSRIKEVHNLITSLADRLEYISARGKTAFDAVVNIDLLAWRILRKTMRVPETEENYNPLQFTKEFYGLDKLANTAHWSLRELRGVSTAGDLLEATLNLTGDMRELMEPLLLQIDAMIPRLRRLADDLGTDRFGIEMAKRWSTEEYSVLVSLLEVRASELFGV